MTCQDVQLRALQTFCISPITYVSLFATYLTYVVDTCTRAVRCDAYVDYRDLCEFISTLCASQVVISGTLQ